MKETAMTLEHILNILMLYDMCVVMVL